MTAYLVAGIAIRDSMVDGEAAAVLDFHDKAGHREIWTLRERDALMLAIRLLEHHQRTHVLTETRPEGK